MVKELCSQRKHEPNIFIHTGGAPTAEQTDFLKRQGVADAQLQRPIITATVSARTVRELSEQPWVRYLKLSSQLRLVDTE
jgi:hypothetical protein